MRIAVIQMSSSENLKDNLSKMEAFFKKAQQQKADIAAFPEIAYWAGPESEKEPIAFDKILEIFSNWAKKYQLDLLPGSLRESANADKPYNTLPYINKQGKVLGSYRKIFLFKANLPDRSYDERKHIAAGNEPVVLPCRWGKVGLSICYDLRFPELFRSLRHRGAEVIFAPASFTVPTGKAHWETLLRCRAIENQVFMVAPALVGACGGERQSYGHSMVVSPWGEVLLNMKERKGVETVEVDLGTIQSARKKIDAWTSRREDIFPLT